MVYNNLSKDVYYYWIEIIKEERKYKPKTPYLKFVELPLTTFIVLLGKPWAISLMATAKSFGSRVSLLAIISSISKNE